MLHLTLKNFTPEIRKSKLPVIVMFYAPWCSKCAMMKPLVEDIEIKYRGRILFCEVEIDESKSLAEQYHADIVPTFAFFRGGTLLEEISGVFEESTFEKYLQTIFRNC